MCHFCKLTVKSNYSLARHIKSQVCQKQKKKVFFCQPCNKTDKAKAKMKFCRAMRDEMMQKALEMRFVVEDKEKKKVKPKPKVIHALGNIEFFESWKETK